jgi:hypothetical protein
VLFAGTALAFSAPMTSSLPTFPPLGQPALPPSLWPAARAAPGVARRGLAPLRAQGHFICDASLQALTTAPWFAQPGRRTAVTLSIRRCAGPAAADTVRGAHALRARFTSVTGAWQFDACSLPLSLHAPVPAPWPDGAPLAPWLWLMSDRALPRSYRMMQGFGTRTYRLLPAHGAPVFARFHWLPVAGTHALAADEAEQLALADPQFLRHDLRDAIAAGAAPSWTLALQVFSERQAAQLGVDPHDPGPLLPADCAPVRNVGRLVLDALDEDSATAADVATADDDAGGVPAPGIEPCPLPGSAWPDDDVRQARLLWCSQSGVEQQHLAAACRAACVAWPDGAARERLRARLAEIDPALAEPVGSASPAPASRLSLPVLSDEVPSDVLAARPAQLALQPAPMLSLLARPGARSVRLRRVALLLAEGFEPESLRSLQRALRLAGARPQRVGMQAGAFRAVGGGLVLAEASIESSPSVLWDAVVLPAGAEAQAALARSPAVARFVQAQYCHGKPILQLGGDQGLLARLGIPPVLPDGRPDPALLRRPGGGDELSTRQLIRAFLEALALPRRFDRGPACEALHASPAVVH